MCGRIYDLPSRRERLECTYVVGIVWGREGLGEMGRRVQLVARESSYKSISR